jgi:hypothetical protein
LTGSNLRQQPKGSVIHNASLGIGSLSATISVTAQKWEGLFGARKNINRSQIVFYT